MEFITYLSIKPPFGGRVWFGVFVPFASNVQIGELTWHEVAAFSKMCLVFFHPETSGRKMKLT